jgi:hypothetical protein
MGHQREHRGEEQLDPDQDQDDVIDRGSLMSRTYPLW